MSSKRGSFEMPSQLPDKQFRRLTGVKPSTFTRMVKALAAQEQAKKKPGRSSKLSTEEQLLMTLQYLREYPTLLRGWIGACMNRPHNASSPAPNRRC